MYYNETWINGRLMFKTTPNGDWKEFTLEMYANRVVERENEVMILELEKKELAELEY